MKKPVFFLIIPIGIIIILSVVQVVVANHISTTGAELSKIQDEVRTYRKENTEIEEQILATSSLIRISEVAKNDGYVETKTTVSLSTPLPLALKQ